MDGMTYNYNSTDSNQVIELMAGAIYRVVVYTGEKYYSIVNKFKDIVENRFVIFDEDANLLEKSAKVFAKGGFLGFEESEKFIASILNAKS